jgi:hypothetical protein
VGGAPVILHLLAHSFLSWAAADPLENADVEAQTLAIAIMIARDLVFMGNPLDTRKSRDI